MSTIISVRVDPEIEARLAQLAEATDRPKSWHLEQALKSYREKQNRKFAGANLSPGWNRIFRKDVASTAPCFHVILRRAGCALEGDIGPELTKAGTSVQMEIHASGEKIGTIVLGRGSISWYGGKRQKGTYDH